MNYRIEITRYRIKSYTIEQAPFRKSFKCVKNYIMVERLVLGIELALRKNVVIKKYFQFSSNETKENT